eukprot:gene9310-6549_t
MVFFSTYRSSRLVAPNAFRSQVLRLRAFADYHFQRSWNGSLVWVIPGDMRLWATIIPMIYFIHRWHNDHTLEVDGIEKALIMRWGGSVEAVRANLSAEDQLRARSTCDLEKLYSAYGPKELLIQPPGDPLPVSLLGMFIGLWCIDGSTHTHSLFQPSQTEREREMQAGDSSRGVRWRGEEDSETFSVYPTHTFSRTNCWAMGTISFCLASYLSLSRSRPPSRFHTSMDTLHTLVAFHALLII